MKEEYISLENEKNCIKKEIKNNKYEILALEKKTRSLKSTNSKLDVKIAEINGKQIKLINNGKETKLFFNTTKGMI